MYKEYFHINKKYARYEAIIPTLYGIVSPDTYDIVVYNQPGTFEFKRDVHVLVSIDECLVGVTLGSDGSVSFDRKDEDYVYDVLDEKDSDIIINFCVDFYDEIYLESFSDTRSDERYKRLEVKASRYRPYQVEKRSNRIKIINRFSPINKR